MISNNDNATVYLRFPTMMSMVINMTNKSSVDQRTNAIKKKQNLSPWYFIGKFIRTLSQRWKEETKCDLFSFHSQDKKNYRFPIFLVLFLIIIFGFVNMISEPKFVYLLFVFSILNICSLNIGALSRFNWFFSGSQNMRPFNGLICHFMALNRESILKRCFYKL